MNLQISMKLDETPSFPHLIMEIKDESSYILFYKRAFSDVLEGARYKIFSGGKPPDSRFLGVRFRSHFVMAAGEIGGSPAVPFHLLISQMNSLHLDTLKEKLCTLDNNSFVPNARGLLERLWQLLRRIGPSW